MNARGTNANIRLIITSLVLLNKQYLTVDDIRYGIEAYTLTIRETKSEYLDLNFEKVQKAFRLCNRAISMDIFKSWCDRMKPFLECNQKERIQFNADLLAAEKKYEKDMNVEFNPNTDAIKPMMNAIIMPTTKKSTKKVNADKTGSGRKPQTGAAPGKEEAVNSI